MSESEILAVALKEASNGGSFRYTMTAGEQLQMTIDAAGYFFRLVLGADNTGTITDVIPPRKEIEVFCQRDPHWANVMLGYHPTHTIGSHGCAVTCAAMIASLVLDSPITPSQLNARLQEIDGFQHGDYAAHLKWEMVPRAVPGLVWNGRQDWTLIPADMEAVFIALEDGYPIIVVDSPPGGEFDTHFVIGEKWEGDDITAIDPWYGDRCGLLERYGKPSWDLARAIYGLRLLGVADE